MIVHPQYDPSSVAWDAALLVLETPSRFSPVYMAPWNARYLTNPRDRFLTAGMGLTQAQVQPDELRAVWVPFVDRGQCIDLAETVGVTPPPFSHICAGERCGAPGWGMSCRATLVSSPGRSGPEPSSPALLAIACRLCLG